MNRGNCSEDNCALSVLATVISTPESHRAVIDAGSKILTSDLFGLKGYGYIIGYPKLVLSSLSEEHGVLLRRMHIRKLAKNTNNTQPRLCC